MHGHALLFILIIAFPIYHFQRWMYIRFNVWRYAAKKRQALLISLLISPILYSLIITLWIYFISWYPKISFNSHLWITHKEVQYQMAHDLIKSQALLGKSKVE